MSNRKSLKVLDVVRTKFGTTAVVDRVNDRGQVSIVLPNTSTQKAAWYKPEELTLIGPVTALVQDFA